VIQLIPVRQSLRQSHTTVISDGNLRSGDVLARSLALHVRLHRGIAEPFAQLPAIERSAIRS